MNWKNSDFQIFYHILGNCHTPIEGLRVLSELRQDRLFAIKSSVAESKRSESKVLASRATLADKSETVAAKMLAICNVEEQDARMEIAQPCFEAAKHELAFIEYLIDALERVIGGPVTELSFQKIQPIENAYDIVVRAHTDISIRSTPSFELINEARNSPYREAVMAALTNLMLSFKKHYESHTTLEFLAMSKHDILESSGIASAVGGKVLKLEDIAFPDIETEKLECKSLGNLRLMISNETSSPTNN